MLELQVDYPTIKAKLLADIQRGEESPEVLGKRYGLNGHDLVKNLEQLRKEGHIGLKWGLGSRVERVWEPKGVKNMRLLQAHVGEDKAVTSEHALKVAGAINRLPWEGEWRKWIPEEIGRLTGLKSYQYGAALQWLRDHDRIVQLGGGSRGVPIKGVRWRGEQPPEPVGAPAPVESVPEVVEAPPEPSQSLADRFPMLTMIIQLGKELEELMNERA